MKYYYYYYYDLYTGSNQQNGRMNGNVSIFPSPPDPRLKPSQTQ